MRVYRESKSNFLAQVNLTENKVRYILTAAKPSSSFSTLAGSTTSSNTATGSSNAKLNLSQAEQDSIFELQSDVRQWGLHDEFKRMQLFKKL